MPKSMQKRGAAVFLTARLAFDLGGVAFFSPFVEAEDDADAQSRSGVSKRGGFRIRADQCDNLAASVEINGLFFDIEIEAASSFPIVPANTIQANRSALICGNVANFVLQPRRSKPVPGGRRKGNFQHNSCGTQQKPATIGARNG